MLPLKSERLLRDLTCFLSLVLVPVSSYPNEPSFDPHSDTRARIANFGHRQRDRQAHGPTLHGHNRRHVPQGRHYASIQHRPHHRRDAWPHPRPRLQEGRGPLEMPNHHHGRG